MPLPPGRPLPLQLASLAFRQDVYKRQARDLPIHQGIFIDLFPLDGYPAEPARQRRLERQKRRYRRLLASAFSGTGSLSRPLLRLLGCHRRTAVIAAAYERMITPYPVAGSVLLANHGNWQGKLDYAPSEDRCV